MRRAATIGASGADIRTYSSSDESVLGVGVGDEVEQDAAAGVVEQRLGRRRVQVGWVTTATRLHVAWSNSSISRAVR